MALIFKAQQERQRCLKLVREYREGIEARAATKPVVTSWEAKAIEKVIASLKEIEREIESPLGGSLKKGADFSLEEMDLAERLMKEQNKNPFEIEG
jgi:hypothetical protein